VGAESLAAFLQTNLLVVRFAYGLIFFTLGLAIVLQPRRQSVYFLSTALVWLSAFAWIHAFADWGLVFIPIHAQTGGGPPATHLLTFRSMAIIISFGLLLQFGLVLLLEHSKHRVWASIIPSAITAMFIVLLVWSVYGPTTNRSWSSTDVKVFSRYLIGGPAAILSAWGLLRQVQVLRRDRLSKYARYLYGAAACFVIYGGLAGLVVPQRPYFPASVLNDQVFFNYVGLPVEVARGLAIFGLTYFTVRILGIFQLETQRRLQAVEQERALLRERERIARELHDGIMQTLYGTGLGLKQVVSLARDQSEQSRVMLSEINREIARAIVQMRRFVLDLKEVGVSGCELAEEVQSLASQIGQIAGIRIQFRQECPTDVQANIPGGVREEVLGVVREGLSNVVRHSEARDAQVVLSVEDDTVLLRIADSGCGFDQESTSVGNGLTSLRERVEALGGFMQVLSSVGGGTQVIAHLPVSRSTAARRKEQSV